MSEREYMDMPNLTVEVDGLGLVTLVANGAGYYIHSGDAPRDGERPMWVLNHVRYTGSVHVEHPKPGETWIVPWPNLNRHPWSTQDATHSAYKKVVAILSAFLAKHAETPEGAAHLRAGAIASANNEAMRLGARLAEIHQHTKAVRKAHQLAEKRCAVLAAGGRDPSAVKHIDTPRGL